MRVKHAEEHGKFRLPVCRDMSVFNRSPVHDVVNGVTRRRNGFLSGYATEPVSEKFLLFPWGFFSSSPLVLNRQSFFFFCRPPTTTQRRT